MANELNWLRSKATQFATDQLVVSEERALESGISAGTYQVSCFRFRGTVPFRMARALSGSRLINTDMEFESLRLGTGYRGGEGACEYHRAVYTLVG